jgi:TolB protein
VRTGTVAASTDGTVRIAGDIAVLHCPDAVVERLQVLFEGVEVASLGSTSEVLLGAGHTLPVLQSAALLRAAGITPERATQHLLQIKRMGSACITGFPIFDDVLAAVALDFTPSTRRLLLVGMEPGSSGIYTINTDGTGRRQLTNSPPYQDNYPTWSPDGRRIAFTRVTRNPAVADPGSPAANIAVLYVMNADGSGLLPLATKHEAEQFAPWSPDGTKLLSYFDPARARDSDPYTYDLHVVNADGSGQVKVHDGTAEVWAAWSPDGRRIAYLDFNDPVLRDPGRLDTYVMNADGSGKTRLTTDGNSQYPTWSPDGTRIAISGRGPNAGFATYVMNADGSGKILVAQDAGLYGNTANPWSPDGRQLVVILVGSGGPAHGILAVYRADGSGQVTASQTSAAFTDGNFSWSPDGRQIAFWRECIDGSTGDSLWVMNADGSSLQPVLSVPRGVNDSWDYAPLWAPR